MKVFIEEQRFNQWWLYTILIIAVMGCFIPFILEKDKLLAGNKEAIIGLTVAVTVTGFAILFILTIKLNTKIDALGIHYRFYPIQFNTKSIKWEDMAYCEVKKYSPIKDYGGHGYKMGLKGKGKALNIRGNMGIQIVLKNKKRILLGTQKPELAKNTIENYRNKITTA